jgi:AraC family transcriptional regulator, carnitine catabolism transcriptional activator
MAGTNHYQVGFLLLPDFSYFGLVAAIQPLFLANWRAQRGLFKWSTLSVDGLPVTASNSAAIPVDGALGADSRVRTLLVLACFDPKQHTQDTRLRSALRRAASFGIEIGGIETGSEVLAAAGLLDGHTAAVHWDNVQGFQERYPKVKATTHCYTAERGRITCGGGVAAIDMMLALVAREAGAALSREVAQQMLVSRPRPTAEDQLDASASASASAFASDSASDSAPPAQSDASAAVRSALALMNEHIEEPLDAAQIANAVGLSARQLRRQFQQSMGIAPMRGYLMIRLSKAHNLLQQTDLSVTEVAVSAGFRSLEHFSRAYRGVFGCAPSTDRHQSIGAPVYRLGSSCAHPTA